MEISALICQRMLMFTRCRHYRLMREFVIQPLLPGITTEEMNGETQMNDIVDYARYYVIAAGASAIRSLTARYAQRPMRCYVSATLCRRERYASAMPAAGAELQDTRHDAISMLDKIVARRATRAPRRCARIRQPSNIDDNSERVCLRRVARQ